MSNPASPAAAEEASSGNKAPIIDPYSTEPYFEAVPEQRRKDLLEESQAYRAASLNKGDFFSHPYHYLISKKWLKRWKSYCSYDERDAEDLPTSKFFGCGEIPVINEDLLDPKVKLTLHFQTPYDHFNTRIQPNNREGVDYEFLTQEMWAVFQNYPQKQLKRYVIDTPDGPKVDVHFQKIIILPLGTSALKDIEHERTTKMIESTLQVSRHLTVETVIQLCKDAWAKILSTPVKTTYHSFYYPVQFEDKKPTKLWRLPEGTEKPILMNTLQMGCKSNPTFGYKIYIAGELLPLNAKIGECEILDTTFVIAEMQEYKEPWCLFNVKNPLQGSCSNCKEVKLLTFLCSCKYAAYCSTSCKTSDKIHHKFRCPNEAESEEEEGEEKKYTERSKRGLTGLRNLGNTCFMNSGLQCLSHVKELTQYFLSGRYINEINRQNRLGTKGELSNNYAKLIKALWYGDQPTFSPALLKKAIGIYQPMFSGYNQHDSGQLITYLLDGLHEDLNRVKEKPYVETKDYDGRPDEIIAAEAWHNFTQRNKSIIVDLMYGQFKSIVDCPTCKYKSIQFDPFLVCSLPIKHSNAKKIEITFVADHIFSKKLQVCFQLTWNWTMKNISDEVKKQIGIPEDHPDLLFYLASYSSCEIIDYKKTAQYVRKQFEYRTIYARELLPGEDPENDLKIMLGNVSCHSYSIEDETYRKSIVPYRIYFVKKSLSNKEVHHKIHEYYKQFSKIEDYEKEVINAQKKEQPVRVLMIATSRYHTCEYCGKKSCDGCTLAYNDEPFVDTVKGFLSHDKKIEMELFWRKHEKEIEKAIEDQRAGFEKYSKPGETSKAPSKAGANINECFKLFEEPEILQEDNAWYCPKCKDFVLAQKQMQIYKAPKILVLCLKRFKRKGEYYVEKFNIFVDFPLKELDISNFVVNHSLPEDYFKEGQEISVDPLLYDLIGVSNHSGGTGGGHYTAYCKDPTSGDWYDFDDSSVDKLRNPNDVISESAYILFYSRKEAP